MKSIIHFSVVFLMITTLFPESLPMDIAVNDSADKVIVVYGTPDNIRESDSLSVYDYYAPKNMNFLISSSTNKVLEIRYNEGSTGKTPRGIAIGDQLETVLQKHDGFKDEFFTSGNETHHCTYGTDRVLYNHIVSGRIAAYKFIDSSSGVLYWFDKDRNVVQIVITR